MRRLIIHIVFLLVLFVATSCSKTEQGIGFSGPNSEELQKVLDNYEDSMPLKQHSAEFIINNMLSHYYYHSLAIDDYTDFILNTKKLESSTMHERWDSLKATNQPIKIYDIQKISCDFIRDDIEQATKVWLHSPWHKDISEEIFLNYVLPYRVKDEPPSCIGWRDSLYNRYHHLIKDVNDVRVAFGIIHKYLLKEFKINDIGGYRYLFSVMDASKIEKGRCINQSAYIVAVMRALGIPASLDLISNWANYSTNGHFWAALVLNDGTYTVERGDSIARKYNKIDASIFKIKDTLESNFPYDAKFKKRVSKVWRYSYMYNNEIESYDDSNSDKITYDKFRYPFLIDVTYEYGFNKNIIINNFSHRGYLYLCTFITGKDWAPATYSYSSIGHFLFINMPDSVIYLPGYFDSNKIFKAFSAPFVLTNNGRKYFEADTTHLQTMTINRKYPFSLTSFKSWPQAIGACFEASNDISFEKADTLYLFTHTPHFRNEISIQNKKRFRYLRYRSQAHRHAYISEIEIYSNGKLLKGKVWGKGGRNPEVCFDGDTYSFLDEVRSGSWVGIDFGKEMEINKLVLFLKNDGDNVVAGKRYELYCFVYGEWKRYGNILSNGYKLTFTNMPSKGVYRLHCIDGGNEEQIFSYENGQQKWW